MVSGALPSYPYFTIIETVQDKSRVTLIAKWLYYGDSQKATV